MKIKYTIMTFVATIVAILSVSLNYNIAYAEGVITTVKVPSSDCEFLTPVTMLNTDLNGIPPSDQVFMERRLPNTVYHNYIALADYVFGCTYYQLDPSVFIYSPTNFIVAAVQMDNQPGLEVIARPSSTSSQTLKTTVVNHSNFTEYLVDFTGRSDYEPVQPKGYSIRDFNGAEGAEIHTYGSWRRKVSGAVTHMALIFQLYPTPELKLYDVGFAGTKPKFVLSGQLDFGGEEIVYVYPPYVKNTLWQDGVVKKLSHETGLIETALIPAGGSYPHNTYFIESAILTGGEVTVVLKVGVRIPNSVETQVLKFF